MTKSFSNSGISEETATFMGYVLDAAEREDFVDVVDNWGSWIDQEEREGPFAPEDLRLDEFADAVDGLEHFSDWISGTLAEMKAWIAKRRGRPTAS